MPHLQENVTVIDESTITLFMPKIRKTFGDNIGNKFIQLLSKTSLEKETDWNNSKITLVDGPNSLTLISGSGSHCWIFYTEDGEAEVVKSNIKKYMDESITVPVINKRVLGKAIIKYIGHEGLEGDKRQEGLRKLLQAVTDYIQKHAVPGVWENATITVYDLEDNTFKFISGSGEHRFMVNERKGQPEIRYTVNNKVKELKRTDEINKENIKTGLFSRFGSKNTKND